MSGRPSNDAARSDLVVSGQHCVVHRRGRKQPQEVQDGLFLATDNDVVAYLDLIES